jgi:hypothetical protein
LIYAAIRSRYKPPALPHVTSFPAGVTPVTAFPVCIRHYVATVKHVTSTIATGSISSLYPSMTMVTQLLVQQGQQAYVQSIGARDGAT